MSWLVTGGAGYIGAHVVQELLKNNKEVVVIDSLINSTMSRINYLQNEFGPSRLSFFKFDVLDISLLSKLMSEKNFEGIIHLAALKSVSESFKSRERYLEVNGLGTTNLLEIAIKNGVCQFIYSSTAAVYGLNNNFDRIPESAGTHPISPYGTSKLFGENAVSKMLKEGKIEGVSLRYFNVVGTSHKELIDTAKDNLVPSILNSIESVRPPRIFGNDYETKDGTAIRDYVDVRDLARAHILAALSQSDLPTVMNIGTGEGSSVKEVISGISEVLGISLAPIIQKRREGDSAHAVADISLAQKFLDFKAEYNLKESIASLLKEDDCG